jgi:cupin fold WbuC family metalloprotein
MKLLTSNLLDELAVKAAASPRARSHLNLHASASDPVQRFFVVVDRQSYVRPHRHVSKSELVLVVRGQFDLITFDDRGIVSARYLIGEDAQGFGFELPRATWHTLVSRVDGSAFMEIKEGPYDPVSISEFATWAPAEGDATTAQFMHWLQTAEPRATPP